MKSKQYQHLSTDVCDSQLKASYYGNQIPSGALATTVSIHCKRGPELC